MKHGAEEALAVCHMSWSLGTEVDGRMKLTGDNLVVSQSASNLNEECEKKHVNAAFHWVRKCDAGNIFRICKMHTDHNFSDPFSDALGEVKFWEHFNFNFAKGT